MSLCTEDGCDPELAAAHWQEDPVATTAEIQAEPDEIRRVALIEVLTERFPGQTGHLCDLIQSGPTQTHCRAYNVRSHLWSGSHSDSRVGNKKVRSAPGPGPGMFLSTEGVESLASQIEAVRVPCPDPIMQDSCQGIAGFEAARLGDASGAAACCAGISDPRSKGECYFRVSETFIEEDPFARIAVGVDLCLASETFTQDCLLHLLSRVTHMVPSSMDERRSTWEPFIQAVANVDARYRATAPVLTAEIEDRLWATIAATAFSRAGTVSGDLLDVLPEPAWPHVRAAAAWRLVELHAGGSSRDLDVWVRDLEGALATRVATGRSNNPGDTRVVQPPDRGNMLGLWTVELSGEERIPSTYFLIQQERRAVHADPRLDATICMVETLGRMRPLQTQALVQALEHPEVLVRWTAARILGHYRAVPTYYQVDGWRDDPMVKARLLLR